MRILFIISTWFLLVWSLHTDRQEFRPVYEIPDYEDFTLQEDNFPSALISWLDNNCPNTGGGKRQRLAQEEARRQASEFARSFCPYAAAWAYYSRLAIVTSIGQGICGNFSVKIFIRICRFRL